MKAKTSFHSFRHNFRDALRDARIERELAYALGGWASDSPEDNSLTAENYGGGYKMATLYDAVASVRYHGLKLDHLKGQQI